MPIGRFERYDTPHPKPFAPKNRVNRNSTDLTNINYNIEASVSNETSKIDFNNTSLQEVFL